MDLVLIECVGRGCGRWFAVCVRHLRGQRYCGERCRAAARKASCDSARRVYVSSIRRDAELLQADRKKRARREKDRRERIKRETDAQRRAVPEHSFGEADACRTIRSEGGDRRERKSSPEGSCVRACGVCGSPGRVRWVVLREAGPSRTDRLRVEVADGA